MTRVRRGLILVHRYLGIPLSGLFVLWFSSGIVMMYTGGMPDVSSQVRHERLAPLYLEAAGLMPDEVIRAASLHPRPSRVTSFTILGRPAYRIDGVTLFADTGEWLDQISASDARVVASHFVGVPVERVEFIATLTEPDQWTVGERQALPVHRLKIEDPSRTEVYVSARAGDVAVLTTGRSRLLAWVGAIPHWMYFRALRENQTLWYRVVVWASTLGCIVALVGVTLGLTQFRWGHRTARAGRFSSLAARIPYAGWMRWHYVTGVVFGALTLTWVFSGLLSMEPYEWTAAEGLTVSPDAMSGGRLDLRRFPPFDDVRRAVWRETLGDRTVKEVEFLSIQGDPFYVVYTASERLLVHADTLLLKALPFSEASLVARLAAASPRTALLDSQWLDDYDSYYYSRTGDAPLPVLRVKFADDMRTWVYVDPVVSRVVRTAHRWSRLERWLFNGLHSLDFSIWWDRRPLWDIGVIALSLGGLVSSGIGLWVGLCRVGRAVRPNRRH